MHELAIAEDLVAAVALRVGEARVVRVVLEVGALTCVEPHAIRFCFAACARGTAVEGASLELLEIPGLARCRNCGAERVEVDARIPLCACGSADLDFLDGGQLRVRSVEVT